MRALLGPILVAWLFACSAGVATTADDAGALIGDAGGDAISDTTVKGDVASDASICGTLGGKYGAAEKACSSASDCAYVAGGCYCGSTPLIGIAKTFVAQATECELSAGQRCALGCPNAPGQRTEDGKQIPDGGTAMVACDNGLCQTYSSL